MKKVPFVLFVFFVWAVFPAGPCLGATFDVKTADDLQNALSIAEQNGEEDLIKIYRGTYYGNFSHVTNQNKLITIRGGHSEGGGYSEDPAITVLNGNAVGMVLKCHTSGGIVIENLSIRNGADGGVSAISTPSESGGKAGSIVVQNTIIRDNRHEGYPGGGLYAESFAPDGTSGFIAILNNTISGNTASSFGGGAFIRTLSKTGSTEWTGIVISNNIVTFNNSGWRGGGIHVGSETETGPTSKITLSGNTFMNNSSQGNGGGVSIEEFRSGSGTSPGILLESNVIYKNASGKHGGGVHIDALPDDGSASPIQLIGNQIIENTAAGECGGLYAKSGETRSAGSGIIVANNTVSKNAAEQAVGGVKVISGGAASGKVILTNNMIVNNVSNDQIGGVHALASDTIGTSNDVIFTNNTISGNRATNRAGGLFSSGYNNEVKIYNNIIWGNEAAEGGDIHLLSGYANYTGWNNNYSGMAGAWTSQGNNMHQDPRFAGTEDFHLTASSPCIDSGTNQAPALPGADIDGDPRVHGDAPDMGADEFVQ